MRKKLLSIILSVTMALGAAAFSAVGASAVTTVTDGDYVYAVASDDTYLLYSYKGEEKSPQLPLRLYGKLVAGIYSGCFEGSEIESVEIPATYSVIGDLAFYNCKNLSSVKLNSWLEELGNLAFGGCTALSEVDLSDTNKLTELPYAAFEGDTALKTITIPSNITGIGERAFAGSGLEELTLPDNLTMIEKEAFADCTSLVTVTFPEGIETVGASAFSGCSSLVEPDFPESLTTIEASAFENCTALGTVFLPDSVTKIGANAFFPMATSGAVELTYYSGSYAEQFCEDNYVQRHRALDRLVGDVNLDGIIDIRDVTLIQKKLIGLDDFPSHRSTALADMNGDGEFSLRDATSIQLYIVTH